MANRMIHTPSYLATAQIGEYWTSVWGPMIVSAGWYRSGSFSVGQNQKTFDSQTGWTVGFKFKYGQPAGTVGVVEWQDGSTAHVSLRFNSISGLFNVERSGTLIQTGTTPLTAGAEYYVEWQVVIADTGGGVSILKIDSVTDAGINSSSLDTRNAANASANVLILDVSPASGAQGCITQFKDIYVNDNSGATDNTFWGPITIPTQVVTADGATTGWSPLSSTNASNVDDAAPDGDSTYNATSTNGATDTFVATDTGYASGTVKGVEWVAEVRRTDASGTARVAPVYRIGNTDYVRTDLLPATTWMLQSQRERLSPATSAEWTVSELDGLQVGYKRTAA